MQRQLQTFWHWDVTSLKWLQQWHAIFENKWKELIILMAFKLQILPTLKHGRWHQHVEKILNIHATEKSFCFLFVVSFFLSVNFPFILDFPWTLGINFTGIKNSNIGEIFYYLFWIDYSYFVCAQYIFVCFDSDLIMNLPFFPD